MSGAFLETTVLTNLLLKKDGSEQEAKDTLAKYTEVTLSQFAWKEFKRGPLSNFRWAHNKLAETKSFSAMLAALQRMSRSPKRYLTATAIQAIHTAYTNLFKGVSLGDLAKGYGSLADLDTVQADMMRLELKKSIYSAWDKRGSLFGGAKQSLSCYPDTGLEFKKERIETRPNDRPKGSACCLQQPLNTMKPQLSVVRSALPDDGRKETSTRFRVLKQLEKHSGSVMGPQECRDFGDAYFVLFCPKGSTIVTTNVRDIEPMATSLGISVVDPTP